MAGPQFKTVACVGTGLIGRGWTYIFTRAGCQTRIYDQLPSQIDAAMAWFKQALHQDVLDGFITETEASAALRLVSPHTELAEAVRGAEYIQESCAEDLQVKKAVFAEIDQVSDPKAIIGSSASSLDMNEITAGLPGAHRCVLAHPFNPPHIIPAVEVMATTKTDPEVLRRTIEFLRSLGQKPMIMNFFAKGYLINRIQAAVVREAIHLVESGLCNAEAVDTAIKDGLGLRWALLGNFGTNNTNADGGIREYYSKFGHVYQYMMNDLDPTVPSFDRDMVERIGRQVDEMVGGASVSELCNWRDRMVRKIRMLKEQDPPPGSA
ncbi:MAG: 3-hydroxyacyl-CoA dehydrogenase NAD-binding domain-containing protein [Pseudomonadota bacterium]